MSTASLLSDRRRAPRALFALMAGQHGVASRAQVRDVGVSRRVEERLVAEGALVRIACDVVAAGGAPLTFSAQAMTAALRPGVLAISHGAAARLHCLAGFEHHPVIEVIGSRGSHIRVDPPMCARYSRGPVAEHIETVGAIPVTSIPLTLALLLPEITRVQALITVGDALRRGVDAAAIREVAQRWREPGRPGPGRLLEIVDTIERGGSRIA